MRISLAIVFSLSVAMLSSACIFIDSDPGVDGVSMYASLTNTGVEIVVSNDNPYPVWVQWADSSYVYQDGVSDWLTVLNVGGTDYTGTPYDTSVPAFSSTSTWVAPSGTVDPYNGSVWIPLGPPGSQVRLLVAIDAQGDRATLDYAVRF